MTPSNDTLAYLMSLLGVGLFIVGVGLQVLTFRKRRPVRPVATWVGQGASLLAMATYSVIVARPPGPIEWMTLLVVGALFGWFYGRLVKVERVGTGVVMSYTLPWLLVWGAILATTQVVSIASGRVPVVLYAAGILSAGLNAGMHARVFSAARKVPDQAVVAALLMLALGASVLGGPAGRAEAYTLDQIAPQLRSVIIPSGGELIDQKDHEPEDPVNVLTYSGSRVDVFYATRFGSGTDQEGYSEVSVYWFRDAAEASEHLKWVESDASNDPRDPVLAGMSGNAVVKFVSHSFIEVDSPYRADQFQAVLGAAGGVDWEGALTYYNGDTPSTDDAQPPPTDTPSDDSVPVPDDTVDPGDGDAPDPGTSDTSASDDELLAWLADFYANQEVSIGQQAAATNAAGGVLMFGSLLQLLLSLGNSRIGGDGLRVVRMGEQPQPPLDPLAGAARSADGRVYYRAPWDEAGAAWMSEAEARRVAEMESQGYHYSNRWGWVSGGQEAEYEATRSRAAEAARAQDPELAAIERRIRDARAGIEAARSEQQRIARIGQLWENQRVLENQMAVDAADSAHWDRIATGANVVKGTADFAVNVLGTYGGPLGRGVRIGYNYTSGLAEGYGNYLAEGTNDPSQLAKHLMVGHATGLVKAGATEAIDYGVGKVVPGVVNYLRGVPRPGPVPPSLLTTQAALKQLTDPNRAVAAEHVLSFVNRGGMQKVAQLEALGHAPAGQVQSLVKVVTAEVDGAVTEGAKQAYGVWNRTAGREGGVRVARVLVGDAGSSSSGALRSAATDADRTFWAVFEKNDLAAYAAKNGVTEAEAAMQLNKTFANTADDSVQNALKLRNIDPAKVDYKTYSGFGRSAGPADTYPTGDALVRQAVGGRTTVVSQTAEGGLRAYRSSGQTLTDEYLLATGNASAAPRIATAELGPLAQRQVESIAAHADVKSVAKALTRLAYVDGRSEVSAAAGGKAMDPLLKAVAQQVRSNPQEAANILRRAGLSEAEFRDMALGAASDVSKRVGAL